MQMGKWPDAAVVLMKFAVACDVTNQTNAQSKAYLSCVVVHLTNRGGPPELLAAHCVEPAAYGMHELLLVLFNAQMHHRRGSATRTR